MAVDTNILVALTNSDEATTTGAAARQALDKIKTQSGCYLILTAPVLTECLHKAESRTALIKNIREIGVMVIDPTTPEDTILSEYQTMLSKINVDYADFHLFRTAFFDLCCDGVLTMDKNDFHQLHGYFKSQVSASKSETRRITQFEVRTPARDQK